MTRKTVTNMAIVKNLPPENVSKPLIRNIGFTGSMWVDSLMSLLSFIIVLSYFDQAPSSTLWDFVLTGTQAAASFLFLVPFGFVVSWYMLSQVKNDIHKEGFVLMSPKHLMVVLGIPFVIIAVTLAFLLNLIDIGLPYYYTLAIFYGFGLGMVVPRVVFTITDMKRWVLLPMYADSDIKRRRASNWRITIQPPDTNTKQS
jgi:hypothetical protein